jgi:hypothetical protein
MPITTTAMIAGITGYLSNHLAKNKSISGFFDDFSEATVNWIRPLFLKEDGEEKEAIQQLKAKPESTARQDAVKSTLAIALEDQPQAEQYLKEIFEKISKTEDGARIVNNIINSTNVNTGNVNTGGGDFIIGGGQNG